MKTHALLLVSLLIFSIGLSAQNRITGKVADKQSKEAVVGAIVKIENTSKAVFTDFDGNFVIKDLAPGKYNLEISYIAYVTKLIKDVSAMDSASAASAPPLSVDLEVEGKQLTEVTVAQTKITNTEIAAVMEMKKSNSIVSTISAAQIQKSQDRDASEVVRRIPGVSIIDNRFIMVRGLSDRYNTVWLNDAGAPSSEADKKAFSFDMISSGLIDRMKVYKTASPELPGDFAGGMVKIYTTAMPQKTEFNISYQGSYREGSTGHNYDHTQIYKNDWLGMGNKDRAIPFGVPDDIRAISSSTYLLSQDTKKFNNDWAVSQKKTSPDQRVNANFNGLITGNNFKFGSVTAINYANTTTNLSIHRQTFDTLKKESDYADAQSTNIARVSAIQNFAYIYKNQKIEFRNFFNQLGRSQTTLRNSNYLTGPNEKSYAEMYDQRQTIASQLSGTHSLFNGKTEYSWTAGYSLNKKDMPDFRRLVYTKQRTLPDSLYFTGLPSGSGGVTITNGGRFYSNLSENIKSFNHNIKQTFKIKNYSFELNAGNYFEYKSRTFKARELGYTINVHTVQQLELKYAPIGQIFAPANLGQGGFQMNENTAPSDTYYAQNKQIATYLAGSFPIGKHLNLQGGMRYENNVQALQTHIQLDSIHPSIQTKYFLPSINGSYTFNEKHILRASFSKTLNRPEFREWAPLYFTDFDFNAGIYGSLYSSVVNGTAGKVLQVCEIQNYDVRYEYYSALGQYIQIGGFYKTFKNPIQQIAYFGASDNSFTFINTKDATVQGIEADLRQNLGVIDHIANTKFFRNLSLVANMSLMKSVMHIGSNAASGAAGKTPLQGQSPYLFNGGFYYQNDSTGTQVSLLFNVFGNRMLYLGTSSSASIGEIGRKTLDVTFSQRVYKFVSITGGVQNILNAAFRWVQDTNRDGAYNTSKGDQEIMNYHLGPYYTLGVKLKF